MALDDILKGFASLNQGLTEYATARALGDANSQLREIQAQQQAGLLQEEQAFQASSMIAQDLGQRLGQVGASPAVVEQQVGLLTPSQGAQFQAKQAEKLQKSSQVFQREQLEREAALKVQLARIKDPKVMTEENKAIDKKVTEFKKGAATYTKAIDGIQAAKTLLDAVKPGQKLDRAVITQLAKYGILKALDPSGRISDADMANAAFEQGAFQKLAESFRLNWTFEEANQNALAFYKDVIATMQQEAQGRLGKHIDDSVNSARSIYPTVDEGRFRESMQTSVGQYLPKGQPQSSGGGQDYGAIVQGYQKALASPEIQKNPAKKKQYEDALNYYTKLRDNQ